MNYKTRMLEVEDVNFHHDSEVFLPIGGSNASSDSKQQGHHKGLEVLRACYHHAKKRPAHSALVVGHTDQSGSKEYNQGLSEMRARNVVALLRGNRDRWAFLSDGGYQVEDVQEILKWVDSELVEWGCNPGPVDNIMGPKTRRGIRNFQTEYNTRYDESLEVTESVTLQLWEAFFDVYMRGLMLLMGTDEYGLAQMRQRLYFLDCAGIGCGEEFPITSDRRQHYRSPIDRRVEILFFEPGEAPPVDCESPRGACTELYEKDMYTFTPVEEEIPETKFEITLSFLGSDHVDHDEDYRCSFELQDDEENAVTAGEELTSDAYRILIDDNHALPDHKSHLLGDFGDHLSRPRIYKYRLGNGWMRDIKPAVGFRVEVKQMRGGRPVPFPSDRFFLQWEIEDPSEEYEPISEAMDPDQPKAWMKNFVKRFRRKEDEEEDDNCPSEFGGARPANQSVQPSDVLYETPFQTSNPQELEQVEDGGGRSPVQPGVDGDGNPIGFSEVVFFPPPMGGDNYQFTLTLTDERGNRLPLQTESNSVTTGTFTIWRKTKIDLAVATDNVTFNSIQWEDVKNAFRAAFIEIEKPKEIKKFSKREWKGILIGYFVNNGIDVDEAVDDSNYDYANYFLPSFSGKGENWVNNHFPRVVKRFLKKAYEDTSRTDPRREDSDQETTPGLYFFFSKPLHKESTDAGRYLGDREFWVSNRGKDSTGTLVHEMGHALFLRHSITEFDEENEVTKDILNDYWHDHDQRDAIPCAMAYSNDYYEENHPVEWHFCGVCLLTLRFYDRVSMRHNNKFRDIIYKGLMPVKISDKSFNEIHHTIEISKGEKMKLKAIGRGENSVNNYGKKFRKDITSMESVRDRSGGIISKIKWVSNNKNVAKFTEEERNIKGNKKKISGVLKGVDSGKTKIYFYMGGHMSKTIKVVVR